MVVLGSFLSVFHATQATAAQNNPKAQQHILDAGARGAYGQQQQIPRPSKPFSEKVNSAPWISDPDSLRTLPLRSSGALPEIMRLAWTDAEGTARVKGLLALSCASPTAKKKPTPPGIR